MTSQLRLGIFGWQHGWQCLAPPSLPPTPTPAHDLAVAPRRVQTVAELEDRLGQAIAARAGGETGGAADTEELDHLHIVLQEEVGARHTVYLRCSPT